MSKIEEILAKVVKDGYKNQEEVTKEFNELVAKYKTVQPTANEESIQVQALNMIVGRGKSFKTTPMKAYIIGFDRRFDLNKKIRDAAIKEGYLNEKNEPIYYFGEDESKMTKNQVKQNKTVIPSEDKSMVRVCYGIGTIAKEGIEENWKPFSLWYRGEEIPPLYNLVTFGATGNFEGDNPSIGSRAMFTILSDEKLNFGEMAGNVISNNVSSFTELPHFEQPDKFALTIFKGIVLRANVSQKADTSNPVELRMPAETIDEILQADNVENITCWCDTDVPIEHLNEGDTVWAVTNTYVRTDGKISYKGFGFFVEKTGFPTETPIPLTPENTQGTTGEEKVWEGDVIEPTVE